MHVPPYPFCHVEISIDSIGFSTHYLIHFFLTCPGLCTSISPRFPSLQPNSPSFPTLVLHIRRTTTVTPPTTLTQSSQTNPTHTNHHASSTIHGRWPFRPFAPHRPRALLDDRPLAAADPARSYLRRAARRRRPGTHPRSILCRSRPVRPDGQHRCVRFPPSLPPPSPCPRIPSSIPSQPALFATGTRDGAKSHTEARGDRRDRQ